MTAKYDVDRVFNTRTQEWLKRMDSAGLSGRALGVRLGDSGGRGGKHGWAAFLRRLPLAGRPPRDKMRTVLHKLLIRDADELLSYFFGERDRAPAWIRDLSQSPFADSVVLAAEPGSAQRSISGDVARLAVGSSVSVSSGSSPRRSVLPSSVRALLADVREGTVSVEEAERALAGLLLGGSSSPGVGSSSWRSTSLRTSSDRGLLIFPPVGGPESPDSCGKRSVRVGAGSRLDPT